MKLIKGVTSDLPMVFFVEVPQGDGIGENLVQAYGALRADGLVKRNRQLGNFSIRLNFASVLVKNGAGTVGSDVVIDLEIFGH
jgi:hypothetical protein